MDQLQFPVCVGNVGGTVVPPLRALIDSGAEDDLLGEGLAMESGCLLEAFSTALEDKALDGEQSHRFPTEQLQ